ncbi:unnamed protein product [Ceratitis capitata]|uniref:(Mediterranean fruit fly) hypothetical protein n=1 Tax=Ceratitis capitata TaxID=7213 RepID=A0A811UI51_CERCA|nr:unnamed protein product [Ceratitis capitata]
MITMEGKMFDNSRLADSREHELSDIIEIISPELEGSTASSKPYLRVVEQPTRKPMRFRYKCEGRTAGTIPGENSFQDTKTFPTVEIVGYNGEALILVSCVTKEKPYRQHPHQLVGKNCKSGVCTKNVGPGSPLRAEFSNIGIQCVRKKEIAESLEERKKKKVDPFKTGFDHITDPNSIELNSLRLCFQGFLKGANGWESLLPVVSEPLYDRKAKSELVISRLCSCAATIDGGDEIILLCSKVNKDDIRIRFKAIDNNREVWYSYAEFEPSNVHKQTAIVFRTPRFPQSDLPKTVKSYIELECPSLEKKSDALEFVFHDPDYYKKERKRPKISGQSLINQMSKDLGFKLNYQSISMGNAFNLPIISPTPLQSNIKDEPNMGSEMPTNAATLGSHFDKYRNDYQMSPSSQISQISPLSPQNRNATPSPISPATNNAYTEQLCTLMQDSSLQAMNCQMHDAIFEEHENQEFGYEASINLNTYNSNSNHPFMSTNHFGSVRNTTSGGYFERIDKSDISPAVMHGTQFKEASQNNPTSEMERIERIKRDLMQTPLSLMQPLPQSTVSVQNGWQENTNFDCFQ